MNVLFITSTRLGDAVLSTGLLAHLIECYPDARFTIACGPVPAPLFAAVPNLDRVIALEKRRRGGHWRVLWQQCIGRRWAVIVDLRASHIGRLLLADRRYVKAPNEGPGHMVEQLARVLDLPAPPSPRLWTRPEHWAAAEAAIPPGPPVLAVSPIANWRGKQWRTARFIELVDRLTEPDGILPGARVAVFGAPAERQQAEPVTAAVSPSRRLDLVGRLDLLTAFLCLRRSAFFVGNDSGLMHLAAAAGVPTLGLFGPSRDELYRPWGAHTAAVRTEESFDELISAPGYDHRTTGTLMDGLSVDDAETAARALWVRCREAAA